MAKKIERNDPCWCGSGKKYKKCHEAFDEKMELMKKKGYAVLDHDLIKTAVRSISQFLIMLQSISDRV